MRVNTKEISATVAYMLGIRKNILTKYYDEECHDLLETLYVDKDATIIRYLCKLRTTLLQKFKKTDFELMYNMKNLDKLEWYDKDNIKQLEEWNIHIIRVNYRSEKYMLDFTKLINEKIGVCRRLFADWLNWDFIKDLFVIPGYTKKNVLINEFKKYMANIDFYPFQVYIHWKPYDCGGLLINDSKLLKELYEMHGEHFDEVNKVKDADDETKNNIYHFIEDSFKVAIAVDCENSDVYKLYGVLKNLNQDELAKIEKIVLYDDYHTTGAWDWLENFIKIPVEHIEVERVTDHKSLVDIKMTAGVCKDYYENGISSFIIVSSDSDYWGLISSLPDASFLVMYEYKKCGQPIKDALTEHHIYHCSIDDFCTGNIEALKRAVLLNILEKYLPDLLMLNSRDLLEQIYLEARIEATSNEKEVFYQKYIRTLRLKLDKLGNFRVEIDK